MFRPEQPIIELIQDLFARKMELQAKHVVRVCHCAYYGIRKCGIRQCLTWNDISHRYLYNIITTKL